MFLLLIVDFTISENIGFNHMVGIILTSDVLVEKVELRPRAKGTSAFFAHRPPHSRLSSSPFRFQ